MIQKTNVKTYKAHLEPNNTTGNRINKSETKRAEDPQVSCQIECKMIKNKIGYIEKKTIQEYTKNRLE
jgi:hypothetical protein